MSHDVAETFCKWMGGYIPSLAQLLRATQGDGAKPGVAALTDAAIACFLHPDPTSQLCGQLAAMDLTNPANGLYPVGRVQADVGDAGVQDVHGEGYEWTRTVANFMDPNFCALSDGATDYVTFGDAGQFAVVQWATLESNALSYAGQGQQVAMSPGDLDPSKVTYQLTVRCAFDTPVMR